MLGYYNGANAYLKNGKLACIRYNTGDWVWFEEKGGEYFTNKILTDDGMMIEL